MTTPNLIGTTLSSYTLLDTLGAGGMGVVYLARDNRLDRTVALKVLPQDLAADAVRRRRFLLEARSASALKHPNVAHVYDVGEADGLSFIVMEHIEGETLADRLTQGRIPPDEAASIAAQAADALADAHERRIVHRDIKPANLMLTGRGQVKILDFGLARSERDAASYLADPQAQTLATPDNAIPQDMTQEGQILGTVPYMSPEQARGDAVDARTDVYSLGVVLYEMLAGRRPFEGRTSRETLQLILAGDRPALDPALPQPLTQLVDRCLEPDRTRRYATAQELFDALHQHTSDSTPASPVSPAQQTTQTFTDSTPARIESLAVMPFQNNSKDEEADYLCDGMAESLIASLSVLPDVRVISRHATFALRDEPRDIQALGDRLQVDALVLGDLRPRGERIVVNVELVGVPDGQRLWGDRYDRPLADAAAVEQDVVDQVSLQLKEALSSDEVDRLVGRDVDPQAYLLYLKGRSLLIGSADQMLKGAQYLEEATGKDPDYALPHAALAESYQHLAMHNLLDPHEARQKARAAARTAVKLDPALPEAQTALGIVRFMFDWDWEGADEAFREGVRMGPGRDVPHLEYADFLCSVRRYPEALRMALRARELDPVSPNPTHTTAFTHMLMGNYQDAVREFQAAIALHPDWVWGHIKLANTWSRMGDHEAALQEIRLAEPALAGQPAPLAWSWVGRVHGAAGDETRARQILSDLQSSDVPLDPLAPAYIHSVLGEKDVVLDNLEQAHRERSPMCAMIIMFERLEPQLELLQEPRYRAILEKMGLPAE